MNSQAYNDFCEKKSNSYLNFIDQCRQKEKTLTAEQRKKCQVHHIVPRHHYKLKKLSFETFDLPENLVLLTFEDHIRAHELRFEVYGEYGDKTAYMRMQGMKEDGMLAFQQTGGQAANALFKEQGRFMHNNEFQREMARRSMERPDAREIRSIAGKAGSRARHRNRTVRVEDRFLWFFEGTPFLCTFNFDNGGDLVRELQKAKETKLSRISGLIKGKRQSAFGWSCEKIKNESLEN